MRYEPIGYIFDLEIGALVVFIVIMLRFFSMHCFPNQKNRLFALIMWAAAADVVLDIVSSIIIDNIFHVQVWFAYLICSLFYSLNGLLLVLMFIYAFSLNNYISKKQIRFLAPICTPSVILLALIATSPITHLLYYVDPNKGYIHAPFFEFIYLVSFFYIIVTFIYVLRNHKGLREIEYSSILIFLIIILFSSSIQFLFPQVQVTGVAIIVSIVLMYFTIQNPESMIDLTTGSFTYEAMLQFLNDRMQDQVLIHIVAIKIHNMPRINELLGVDNGSLLLKQLFQFLSKNSEDIWTFRMRGSCFVAITRKDSDYEAIKTHIEEQLSKPWNVNGTDILLHASVCFMGAEDSFAVPKHPEETVYYIESALDETEKTDARIVSISTGQEFVEKVERRKLIEQELRDAVINGSGLELYFQPLWSVDQNRYVSAEVLLRFKHSVLGFVPPDEFITIAERNGFITALDEFVIRETCSFLNEHDHLQEFGFENLEINLSALEFMQKRLPEQLRGIITEHHINPEFLCFEVTETAATESFELLKDCMTDIIKQGCKFALDDFGTGYANISQVIQLPFSTVKLDKSMLYGPTTVLEDVIRMFDRIDRKTIIEGVETAEQAELVQSFGIDLIQGFYYAKPMNRENFCKLLKENQPSNK